MKIRKLCTAFVFVLGLTMALLWLLGAGLLPIAHAANFGPTKFSDDNGTCDVGDCSLREAIIAANGNGQADTITLGAGTYHLTLTSGTSDADYGDLDITGSDALTITGVGPGLTIIDANGIDRVFEIHSGAGPVVISGVTIISGTVTGNGGGIYDDDADLILINTVVSGNVATGTFGSGGGVFVLSGTLTLSAGQVVSNSATGDGGGVYISESSAIFTQTGVSTIAHNTASGAFSNGGGVFVSSGRVTLSGGQILNNSASGNGGGLYISDGRATLSGGQILSNTAGLHGGGVYIHQSSATFTQTGVSTIAHNSASSSHGGGVYVYAGSATLSGGQILSNTAGLHGGGVYVDQSSATFNQTGVSTIAHNTADYGGGVFVNSGTATLSGGQILSNTASGDGGGMYVNQSSATFTQTGVSTIAHNTASGAFSNGGGVFVSSGRVTLSGGQILNNSASGNGGGLYISDGRATLSGGQILSNTAGLHGGGVYIHQSSATFTQTGVSTIAHNSASSSHGGGVYVYAGSATLSGGQILSNTAGLHGGGVYVDQSSATFNQTGVSTIAHNTADYGGGMFVYNGTATLSGGQISSNTASGDGGGVFVDSGQATLSGEQISSNTASDNGGGIFNHSGTLNLANTTVSRNTATTFSGGGLYSGGTVVLTHTTIASNTASSGGDGVHRAGGTVLLRNTIVAHNGAANCNGGLTSDGYNLEDGATCGLTGTGDITNTNPLLGPLADNGGDTQTHALLAGSPAIDAAVCVSGLATDQRGIPRPQGSQCDIGAYEKQNERPDAVNDSATVDEGGTTTTLSGGQTSVLHNDTDPENDTLTVNTTPVTPPIYGSLTLNGDGTFIYTHDDSENHSDSFTYEVCDDGTPVLCDTATVNITINPVNDPPDAVNDSATVDEGGTVNIDLTANDTDVDGTVDDATIIITSGPTNGSVTVNANGTVDYTHDGSETTSDSFTYTVKDDDAATSNAATVTITVTPVNDPPDAVNDSATVDEGGTVNIDLTANDTDVDGTVDDATIIITSGPTNGSVTVNANGTVDYTHDGSETTSDSFTYQICDDGTLALCDTATVTVNVVPAPAPAENYVYLPMVSRNH